MGGTESRWYGGKKGMGLDGGRKRKQGLDKCRVLMNQLCCRWMDGFVEGESKG